MPKVCNNITEADSFIICNDQLNFKINHGFDCNEKCLIYLITCIGQIVAKFRHNK